MIPNDTPLGKLTLTTVYDYYDGPINFVVTADNGVQYLVYWADVVDTTDVWLYLRVSDEAIVCLVEGNLPIRKAFLEGGEMFIVKTGKQKDFIPVQPKDIPQDWLPLADATLS